VQKNKPLSLHFELLTVSCVVVVFLNAKIYVFVLYKMAFHFLIFNLERHQREDLARESCNGSFRPWKQLQWLFPPMEVINLQHSTKRSL
jgi:hypothetical protein